MKSPYLLIGAISNNYSVNDIRKWVETSKYDNTHRTLLLYNGKNNIELIKYLSENSIEVITPDYDYYGQVVGEFPVNTGTVNIANSYNLVHNIRFLHIHDYLKTNSFEKVFTTDVKDVYFNRSPFPLVPLNGIIATGEVIKYNEDQWNTDHLFYNLGICGYDLLEQEVLNVGVFGGSGELVKKLCKDIYLLSCGRHRVADQTSFNYLIRNTYKDVTQVTSIEDNFAVHLHVVSTGQVPFNLDKLNQYTVVHQYDRIK